MTIANVATLSAKYAVLRAVDSAVEVTHMLRSPFSTGWPVLGSLAAAASSEVGSPFSSRKRPICAYVCPPVAASVILIAFGAGSLYMGFDGRDQVRGDLAREQIVGTPDSTIPVQKVDTGREAQAFAAVIRKHTLEATGGQTYAQMGRFLDEKGNPTSDEAAAAKDPETGKPVENGLRNMWVTSTALSTALNTAYFAESVATFAIVMGVALLLTGVGFLVLTVRVLLPVGAPAKTERGAATAIPTTS